MIATSSSRYTTIQALLFVLVGAPALARPDASIVACYSDLDCAPHGTWCRALDPSTGDYRCTDYLEDGASCTGMEIQYETQKCRPGSECVPHDARLPTGHGTCRPQAESTVTPVSGCHSNDECGDGAFCSTFHGMTNGKPLCVAYLEDDSLCHGIAVEHGAEACTPGSQCVHNDPLHSAGQGRCRGDVVREEEVLEAPSEPSSGENTGSDRKTMPKVLIGLGILCNLVLPLCYHYFSREDTADEPTGAYYREYEYGYILNHDEV